MKQEQEVFPEDTPYIPFSIDSFSCYEPLPAVIYVHSKRQEALMKGKQPEVVRNNISIYNKQGTLLARFNNLTSKRIRHPELIKKLVETATEEVEKLQHGKTEKEQIPVQTDKVAAPVLVKDSNSTDEAARSYLRAIIGEKLQKPITALEDETGFYDLGLDSKQTLELVGELEKKCGHEFYPTLMFEYQSIEDLAEYLAQ